MRYFIPFTMTEQDAHAMLQMMWTCFRLNIASQDSTMEMLGLYNFVLSQSQLLRMETDYDDHH